MVNDADGSQYPTRAVYDEVRDPELLAWTESSSGMQVTTEFVALGPDRTEVRIHQRFVPEALLAPEAQAGFLTALDRFDSYLRRTVMTFDAALRAHADLSGAIAEEYRALADLLEASGPAVWDAPSLCEGWRTREVVAHMTMPARYSGPVVHGGAGGRRRRLHAPLGHRGRARRCASAGLPPGRPPLRGAARLAATGRRGGGRAHPLRDPRPRHRGGRAARAASARRAHRPGARDHRRPGRAELLRGRPQGRGAAGRRPGMVLRLGHAGVGEAQALALVVCGRLLPPGRLDGEGAARFTAR